MYKFTLAFYLILTSVFATAVHADEAKDLTDIQQKWAIANYELEDDAQIDKEGVSVVIDSMSYPFLVGSQVDYQEDLQGSKFVVSNPNASSTCGCGASFAI